MEKINFVNQSTPAVNDTNLNKLQDNVEDAIQEVQDDVDSKLDISNIKTAETTSNTDTYSCNYTNEAIKDVYSTVETKTNELWIDGRPIYKKVLDIGSYTWTNGTNAFPHNVSNFDILIDLEYIMQWSNDDWYKKWDQLDTENWVGDASEIRMNCLGDSSFKKLYLIIKYTKTTD